MLIERYIQVKGIRTDTNELIPIWDERLSYVKDDFGKYLYFNSIKVNEIIKLLYDMKTKTISHGIDLDIYPSEDRVEFKVGEAIYYEVEINTFKETKIKDIVFEDYDITILSGKKIKKYYDKVPLPIQIDEIQLYCIKHWKPYFILTDDTKVEHTYSLKHKAK